MKGGLERWTEAARSAVQAIGQTAVAGAQTIGKKLQQEALGAECLLPYAVGPQTASAGPAGIWRVYTARSKKEGSPHPVVSAWVLDKRDLSHIEEHHFGSGGGGGGGGLTRPSARRLEAALEQARHDVQALARLKHPCVLRLISPLEETRTQLVFITEPVFASLADLLGGSGTAAASGSGASGLPSAVAAERRSLRLSELETKHGLLQVADGLHFLHSEAGLVHRGICPASIVITQSGAWKLAGFAFSTPQDFQTPSAKPYDYTERDPSVLQQVTQPCLQYVAPELVASGTGSITGAADIFSLGAVAFELFRRRQLLPVGHSLAEYESRVHSLTLVDTTGVPPGLEQPLRSMIAPVASARPPAAAFAGVQYFQADVLLRALKFLDTMIQRDSLQKAAFLRDLPSMCAQFDSRVLRYKVLPPLLQELRDPQLQPTLLPIVLKIVQQQDPGEFADATLPALRPLLASASGDTLLLLVQNSELLARCMPAAAAAQVLPALLVRAAQHGDVRAQEEALKKVAAMADTLDYEGLKQGILPAVHALCLGTTSASVRVSAFAAMSRLVSRMDQAEAEAMLATAVKVCAVDKSAPTAMCVLALGGSLAKQWGPRLAAERVLPTLAPLLVVPTLNTQQFGTAMKTVRDVLAQIEKGRAGAGGEGADGSLAAAVAAANGGIGGSPRPGAGTAGAAAPSDWLAATEVGPGSGGKGRQASRAGSSQAGGDPLAGLQLNQPASPAAASPTSPGSSGRFGIAGGQVGSGRPLGGAPLSSLVGSQAGTASQGANWAFAAAPSSPGTGLSSGGMGAGAGGGLGGAPMARFPQQQQQQQPVRGSGFAMGSSGMATSGLGGFPGSAQPGAASSLADPFAGLQLGPGSAGASSGAAQWPAAGPSQPAAAPVFDPFSLGNAGAGSVGGAPLRPAMQQQQPRPSAGSAGAFAAGLNDSLI